MCIYLFFCFVFFFFFSFFISPFRHSIFIRFLWVHDVSCLLISALIVDDSSFGSESIWLNNGEGWKCPNVFSYKTFRGLFSHFKRLFDPRINAIFLFRLKLGRGRSSSIPFNANEKNPSNAKPVSNKFEQDKQLN